MKRSWLALLIVLCMLCLFPGRAEAADIIASGDCGTKVTWSLDSDWTLTISGSGAMKDYFQAYEKPWHEYRTSIHKVVIEPGVTAVGYNAFADCSGLSEVVLPETVTEIRSYAFSHCSSLRSIEFPSSLVTIGVEAFRATGLETLNIPATLKTIEGYAFRGCNRLTSLYVPATLEKLSGSTFYECENLVEVIFEHKEIPYQAFTRCYSLKSIIIGQQVTEIGIRAFQDCTGLVSLVIPDNITSMSGTALSGCENLAMLYLGKNSDNASVPNRSISHVFYGGTQEQWAAIGGADQLTNSYGKAVTFHFEASAGDISQTDLCSVVVHSCAVCDGAVYYETKKTDTHDFEYGVCTSCGVEDCWTYRVDSDGTLYLTDFTGSRETLVIPGYIEGIPVCYVGNTTDFTKGAKHVVISEGVVNIQDSGFSSNRRMETLSLPSTLRTIGYNAFSWCNSLKELILPEGVTAVGRNAFSNCTRLTSVTLPKTLTSIQDYAFQNCNALTQVHISDLKSWLSVNLSNALSNPAYYGADLYCDGEKITHMSVPEGTQQILAYTAGYKNLLSVSIPESVAVIEANAFAKAESLEHLVYLGTPEQWAAVAVKSGNDPLTSLPVHYGLQEQRTQGTCDNPGVMTYTCGTCGKILFEQTVQPTGHNWGPWVETVSPTESADGISTRICAICGEEETKPLDNNIFTDVNKDRFEDAILWAYYNGITTGTGNGTTFSPENACTRKQIVTFLWRAAGEPEPESMVNPFTDVNADRFEKAILWAYYKGITTGTGDGTTFSPENTCTRKQIVTFLWRAAGEPAPAFTANPFTDVKSDRFENAILWAYYRGITTGTGNGTTFSPENSCTRKQIVTFLYRNEKNTVEIPSDPARIIADAYALGEGQSLPYTAALTGVITGVETPWDEQRGNISVVITVEGADGKPILCYRLSGEGAADLARKDTVTVIGTLGNYNGTVQFLSGCILADVVKHESTGIPTDPLDILEAAYALNPGEALPYQVTLTGTVFNIDQQYTGSNDGAFLDMRFDGCGTMTVSCMYLTGDDMIDLRAGDVITVTGTLKNYGGTVVFVRGCTGVKE